MNSISEIYKQDLYHVKKWGENYTDDEFYAINRKLRMKLDTLVSNKKLSPKQKFMAGMVYHHGFTISSSRKALEYARDAYEKGYKPAKTLIAQATDRLLHLQGKPQKFGTQAIETKGGKWKMWKIDGSVTDKDRKAYGLPSLSKLEKYLTE